MNTILKTECNLSELNKITTKLAKTSKPNDIYLLKGSLGVGKTTFTRFFINSIFEKNTVLKPISIKSPTFPILINYSILDYEINHYDLYRIEKHQDLLEIGLFDSFENNITIIEWPEIFVNNFNIKDYFLIEFEFINLNKRKITIKHNKLQEI